jgi:hypothetical protein
MSGRDNNSFIAAAVLLLGGAAALAWPRPAHAQFGASAVVTVPGSVTSDQAAEASLADIDTVQLPNILTQDTATATSVSTGGGAGFYVPNATLIANLDQQLFSQVNSQNAADLFPGFQPLPANTITDVQGISAATLATYANALADAQAQGAELTNENFTNIETASANTTDLLAAVQANTEVGLQVASELQYIRQQLNTLIEVEATKASEEMNERSQEAATSAVHFNGGSMP